MFVLKALLLLLSFVLSIEAHLIQVKYISDYLVPCERTARGAFFSPDTGWMRELAAHTGSSIGGPYAEERARYLMQRYLRANVLEHGFWVKGSASGRSLYVYVQGVAASLTAAQHQNRRIRDQVNTILSNVGGN